MGMDLEYCINGEPTSSEDNGYDSDDSGSGRTPYENWIQPAGSRRLQYAISGSFSLDELAARIDKLAANWRENDPRLIGLLMTIYEEMDCDDYVHFRTE